MIHQKRQIRSMGLKHTFLFGLVGMLIVSCQPETEILNVALTTVATRTVVPPSVIPTKVILPTMVEIKVEATDTTMFLPTLTPLPTFALDELGTAVCC